MYLLDTNVVSESRKLASGRIDSSVKAWLTSVDPGSTFLSAMSVFELERGVLLQERRDAAQGAMLRRWMKETVLPAFSDRILPMTSDVAARCAQLHVPDPQSERDSWIAATAFVHHLTVVTRNTSDFKATRVSVINPWLSAPTNE
ncbi:twitching motility protein PilT (plasmid) [Sphingomonas panacis]|uniref:Twitching motility protein PilT n=1 Tax=Sphingomonas panacis TaxID=1560345 RepID=A0A1B3ZIM3_9SPHN|nr:type II toxin-antitoxin system VapC family toxin [Sphingomonas panacis]AOH87273.1 twitching motility protein PilT [Sphingomonas panacis]